LLLKDLEDKYKGCLAFVVGAGPSLHFEKDIDRLRDYVVIAVNAGFLKVKEFADVFVGDDKGLASWSYYQEDLKKSDCLKLLYEDKLGHEAYHLNNVVFFKHKWWYSPQDRALNFSGLQMTKNAWKPLIGARTTMGTGCHAAYLLGAGGDDNPICLLGADCCFSRDGQFRYYWQFPGEQTPYRTTGELVWSASQGRHQKTGASINKHCLDFLEYWHLLSIQTKKQGINIINASGGILESFPRLELPEVLEKYGDRKKKRKG
tara:strand:+ start:5019 stop:5801 length:783 start_codon:yes stop_codon:yes gene_type:complete